MAKISKSERLLNLVSFLLKARRPVSFADIRASVTGYAEDADMASASLERRFERDKVTLRDLGVPLQFVTDEEPGGPGYLIPRDAYFLPHIELESDEAAVLAMAGKLALADAAGPISDALASALRKIQFDAPIPGGIRETAEERFLFQRSDGAASPEEHNRLESLSAAVFDRKTIRFTYYTLGGDRTAEREVDPYGMGFAEGHWYLAGYDRAREDIRVFRVDRILSDVAVLRPRANQPDFQVPSDFKIEKHVGLRHGFSATGRRPPCASVSTRRWPSWCASGPRPETCGRSRPTAASS